MTESRDPIEDRNDSTQSTESEPRAKDLHDEGARLIVQAFERARAAGHENWERMTTAVLKNRLLDLTDRSFAESTWGASTFREFLDQFSDVVELDPGARPATVRLVGEAGDHDESPIRPGVHAVGRDRQVRPDLWRAVLDYSSGRTYGWDQEGEVVKPFDDSEVQPGIKKLPGISKELLYNWRGEFAADAEKAGASPMTLAAIQRWRADGLPDRSLPGSIRRRWNGELKRHVVALLEEWFSTEGLTPPPNLISTDAPRRSQRPADDDLDALRRLVVRCVQGMTRAELEELRLPPAALLRSRS